MGALQTIPYEQYQQLPPEKRSRPLTDQEFAALTPEELAAAGLAERSEGAPANFGGRVLPNPENIQPHLDTDPIAPVTRLPVGVTFHKQNFTGAPEMDLSNPSATDVIPAAGRTIAAQMTATPQHGPWEKYAKPAATTETPSAAAASGPWTKYAKPAAVTPPAPKVPPKTAKPDRFAADKAITDAWAEKHPILGPIARALVTGGQSAANAITETPGQVYHAVTDPSKIDELGLTPEQRLIYRMGGKQAIEAGQDYASGKVTPAGAESVLPEAIGTGLGTVAGGAVYGKGGEIAGDVIAPAAKAIAENPKAIATAPIRLAARSAETLANQKLVPVRKIANLNTPADAAEALDVKIPGRDFGLSAPFVDPGAPLPENPGALELNPQYPGAPLPAIPPAEVLNPSLVSEARTLPGQISPEVISPKIAKIEPAAPIPPRSGLALPAAPAEASAASPIPRTAEPAAAPTLLTKTGRIKPAVAQGLQDQIERGLGNEQPVAAQPIAKAPAAAKLPEGFTPVESTALKGYKYDPAAREFEYITKDGSHYVRGDVAPEAAAQFEKTAAEKGSFGTAWHELRNNPQGGVGQFKVINGKRVAVVKTAPVTDLADQIKNSAGPSTLPARAPISDLAAQLKTAKPADASAPIPKAAAEGDLTEQLTRSVEKANADRGRIPKASETPDYQSLIDAAMKEGPAWTPQKASPIVEELNKLPGNKFEVRGSVGEGRATSNDLDLWQKSGNLKDARATLEKLGFKYNGKTPHGETYTNGAQHVDLWDSAHEPVKGYTGAKENGPKAKQ